MTIGHQREYLDGVLGNLGMGLKVERVLSFPLPESVESTSPTGTATRAAQSHARSLTPGGTPVRSSFPAEP